MDLQSLKIDRTPAKAPRPRRSPWPLRLLGLGLLGGLGWLFGPALAAYADRLRLPEVAVYLVAEAAPAAAAAVEGTAANGYVVAARRAALSSDVPGRIVEMRVKEGAVVRRGDIVARLFADEYRAALQRAAADVAVAEASVRRAAAAQQASAADLAQADAALTASAAQVGEAEAQLRWLEAERQRVEDLLAQGIGAARDRQRAQSDAEAQRARVQALQAQAATAQRAKAAAAERLTVAGAELTVAAAQRDAAAAARDLAQATLDKTDVRAPFDGVVVLKDAEVGEVVSPNVQGGSNARGAVCTMVDFDSLEVQANVPETTLASVQLGGPADVFLDAWPDDRYPGVVDRIWPTADRQKATVEVRVRLERKDERLRPEMGVRVVFRRGAAPAPDAAAAAAPRAILVPETTLVERGGATGTFVLDGDVARFTRVEVGERKGGRAAVQQGLRAGQRLVLNPPAGLQDGQRVRLPGS